MARFRDKIVHHYFDINYEIVWDTSKKEIPKIISELKLVPELINLQKQKAEKQLSLLVFYLTGSDDQEEQRKILLQKLHRLGYKPPLRDNSSYFERMSVPEILLLLLKVQKERKYSKIDRNEDRFLGRRLRKKSPDLER